MRRGEILALKCQKSAESFRSVLKEASLDGEGRLIYLVSRTEGRMKTSTAGLIEAGLVGLDYLDVPRRAADFYFRMYRFETRVKVAASRSRLGLSWDL